MALLQPIVNPIPSLAFGPTDKTYEPAGYGQQLGSVWTRAAFSPEAGFVHFAHFHTAQDYAAPTGTPILASEDGTVVFCGWDTSGGGYKIEVSIRAGVSYASNHCQRLLSGLGSKVKRGQQIATVGETGLATGPHDHFWVQINEVIGGVLRHNLFNPLLFMAGGALADDPRIKPATIYAAIAANQHIYDAPILSADHVLARDESKAIQLRYLGAQPGDDYRYGSPAKVSDVWAKLDAGNAAHTIRFAPYYRVQSFVQK